MKSSRKLNLIFFTILLLSTLLLVNCEPKSSTDSEVYIKANTQIEAGRYLVIVGGCNDCHTEGYLQNEGNVPEQEWLAGSMIGWRGPWGTTYASNLRLFVQDFDEDDWVETLKTRTSFPPMPWMNINKMSEKDMRALYQYIKSLGAKGEEMPQIVPPEEEPTTPYVLLMPQNIKQIDEKRGQ